MHLHELTIDQFLEGVPHRRPSPGRGTTPSLSIVSSHSSWRKLELICHCKGSPWRRPANSKRWVVSPRCDVLANLANIDSAVGALAAMSSSDDHWRQDVTVWHEVRKKVDAHAEVRDLSLWPPRSDDWKNQHVSKSLYAFIKWYALQLVQAVHVP